MPGFSLAAVPGTAAALLTHNVNVWLLEWGIPQNGQFSHWERTALSLQGVVLLTVHISTPFTTPKFPHSLLSSGFEGCFLNSPVWFNNWYFEENQGEFTPLLKDMLNTYNIQSNIWNQWRNKYRSSSFVQANIRRSIRVHLLWLLSVLIHYIYFNRKCLDKIFVLLFRNKRCTKILWYVHNDSFN